MSEWGPKRFWTKAEVAQTDDGWTVTLDGRAVRSPAKTLLVVPTEALADAIAAEWRAQGERVNPATMPFTRTANSALDKVAVQQAEVAAMLSAYGDSDLLCYRADAPDALVARQQEAWDPMLDWAAETYGARLRPRTGVMHVPQDAESLQKLGDEVNVMSPFQLAGFHDLVALTGSLVLGLATTRGARSADAIWSLSRIDEKWQEEQWGTDDEATRVAERKKAEFLQAEHFYRLSSDAP